VSKSNDIKDSSIRISKNENQVNKANSHSIAAKPNLSKPNPKSTSDIKTSKQNQSSTSSQIPSKRNNQSRPIVPDPVNKKTVKAKPEDKYFLSIGPSTFAKNDFVDEYKRNSIQYVNGVNYHFDPYRDFLFLKESVDISDYHKITTERLIERFDELKKIFLKIQSRAGMEHHIPHILHDKNSPFNYIKALLLDDEKRAKLLKRMLQQKKNELINSAVELLWGACEDDKLLDWNEFSNIRSNIKFHSLTEEDWNQAIRDLKKQWNSRFHDVKLTIESREEYELQQKDKDFENTLIRNEWNISKHVYDNFVHEYIDLFLDKTEAEDHLSKLKEKFGAKIVDMEVRQAEGWAPCPYFNEKSSFTDIQNVILDDLYNAAKHIVDPSEFLGYLKLQKDSTKHVKVVQDIIDNDKKNKYSDMELAAWEFLYRTEYRGLPLDEQEVNNVIELLEVVDAFPLKLAKVHSEGILSCWAKYVLNRNDLADAADRVVNIDNEDLELELYNWLWAAGENRLRIKQLGNTEFRNSPLVNNVSEFISEVVASKDNLYFAQSFLDSGLLANWLSTIEQNSLKLRANGLRGLVSNHSSEVKLWMWLWSAGYPYFHLQENNLKIDAKQELVENAERNWHEYLEKIADGSLIEWIRISLDDGNLADKAEAILKEDNELTDKALYQILYNYGFKKLQVNNSFIKHPDELVGHFNHDIEKHFENGCLELWCFKGIKNEQYAEIIFSSSYPEALYDLYWELGWQDHPNTDGQVQDIKSYIEWAEDNQANANEFISGKDQLTFTWLDKAMNYHLSEEQKDALSSPDKVEILQRMLGGSIPKAVISPASFDLGHIEEGSKKEKQFELKAEGNRGYLFGNCAVGGKYASIDLTSIPRLQCGESVPIDVTIDIPKGSSTGNFEGELSFVETMSGHDFDISSNASSKFSWSVNFPLINIILTASWVSAALAILLGCLRYFTGDALLINGRSSFYTKAGFIDKSYYISNSENIAAFIACLFILLVIIFLWTKPWIRDTSVRKDMFFTPTFKDSDSISAFAVGAVMTGVMITAIGVNINLAYYVLQIDSFASGMARTLLDNTWSVDAVVLSWALFITPIALAIGLYAGFEKFHRPMRGFVFILIAIALLFGIRTSGTSNSDYANLAERLSRMSSDNIYKYTSDPYLEIRAWKQIMHNISLNDITISNCNICKDAPTYALDIIKINKDYDNINGAKAFCYYKCKDLTSVDKHFALYISIFSKTNPTKKKLIQKYVHIIKFYKSNGLKYYEAKWLENMASNIDDNKTNKSAVYRKAGEIYSKIKKYAKAKNAYKNALKLDRKRTLKDEKYRLFRKNSKNI